MNKGKEKLVWIALFLLSFFFYPFALRSSWESNSDIHSLLEFFGAVLAIMSATLILVLFFATGRSFFLLLSLGFTIQGAEDLIHAIYSFSRIWPTERIGIANFVPGTYTTGRLILVAFIFISLILAKSPPVPKQNRVHCAVKYNILAFMFSAFLTAIITNLPLPKLIFTGHLISRPLDLAVGVVFLAMFFFFIRLYRSDEKYRSPFEFSIIASIIVGFAAQIYMSHSQKLYDAQFDMAHLAKIFSYIFPIFGIGVGKWI